MNHIIKIVQYENFNLNEGKLDQNGTPLPENIIKKFSKTFYSGVNLSSPITGSSIKETIKIKNSFKDVIEESLKLKDDVILDTDTISFGIGTVTYEVTLPSPKSVDLSKESPLAQKLGQMKYSSKAKSLSNTNKTFLGSKWSSKSIISGSTGQTGLTGATGAAPIKSMKVKNSSKAKKSGPTGPIKTTTINPIISATGPTSATA